MKRLFVLAGACSLVALATVGSASAETLGELAQRTHFHGIAVNRSGTAPILLASHHGIYAVSGSGEVMLVSPVQDYMGFSPDPAEALTFYASGHPAQGGNLGFLKSADGGANWTQVSVRSTSTRWT